MDSSHDQIERVWDIAEKIGTCMVSTVAGGGLRSRPMHAMPDRESGCLWFITDNRGAKEEEINSSPEICLAFAEPRNNTFLSITGRADIRQDADRARALWNNEAQAWWPNGPTDPNVRVLRVVPQSAEYWDTRGNSVIVALKLAAARYSGKEPELGANVKVDMT
jgi:general stress protein 26